MKKDGKTAEICYNEVISRTKTSLSEIMTILIMYNLSGYNTFKWYYIKI